MKNNEAHKETLVLNKSTGDYLLKPDAIDVSICIRNIRIYVRLANWGVHVAMESLAKDAFYPLTSTWLSFDEAALAGANKNTKKEVSPNKSYLVALISAAIKHNHKYLTVLLPTVSLLPEVEMDTMCEQIALDFGLSVHWEYEPTHNTDEIQLSFQF